MKTIGPNRRVVHDLLMANPRQIEANQFTHPTSSDSTVLLSNAFKAVQRGASLTQRMLAFSRKQDLRFEEMDLMALIQA